MDLISTQALSQGLAALSDPTVWLWIWLGSFVGLVFGATPGLTAPAAIALVLPLTYSMGVEASLALLLGIYVSGYFSGSIPAILINTPGTPGNAATVIEGYQMARRGRGDEAITLAIVSSFNGVLISVIVLLLFAPLLAKATLLFTSVEYFALAFLGILCIAGISQGSMLKGIAAALLGVLVSTVGIDQASGVPRFTFDQPVLLAGVALIPALIGLFAFAEMLVQSRSTHRALEAAQMERPSSVWRVFLTTLRHRWTALKSALFGVMIGILPGTGPAIASWIAYGEAVRNKKPGDQFGKGEVKGLIACETSNNAVIGGAMIPLLTLGIPGDPVTAILVGALMIQGIQPGPFFMRDHAGLFVAIVAMLLVSNIAMVTWGTAIKRLAARIVTVPNHVIVPVVIAVSASAVYAVNHTSFEVLLMGVFGLVGFLMLRHGFPVAAVVLGIVLGPILEVNFRNALVAHEMDLTVFLTRPISAALFLAAAAIVAFNLLRARKVRALGSPSSTPL